LWVFVLSWIASLVFYRLKAYDALEVIGGE